MKDGSGTETPDTPPPEDTPLTPEQMMENLKNELRTCVGSECNKIREELNDKSVTLSDDQLKNLHADLDKSLKDDFDTNLKGLNSRVAQYGNKIDQNSEQISQATTQITTAIESLKAAEEASKKAAEEARAATEAAPEECPNCGYGDLGAPPADPADAVAACKECKIGFTEYETAEPKEDGTGGQGYKFCPQCGDALVPTKQQPSPPSPGAPPKP